MAAFVACYWWFGSAVWMNSQTGQDVSWSTSSVHLRSQGKQKGRIADVDLSAQQGRITAEDWLDVFYEKEGGKGPSVGSWGTGEKKVRDVKGAGTKGNGMLNYNKGDQTQGAVMEKAEVVREEGRGDVEVRKLFAGPPWLRYSRLESGSWMCSAYHRMNDEGKEDEEERMVMKSESWHKG